MEKTKISGSVLWIIIGFIVLAGLFLVSVKREEVIDEVSNIDINQEELADRSGDGLGAEEKTASKKVIVPVPKITYIEALEKYKDYRIQFDSQCQARPNNVTYKNGTNIMLDNRSGTSKKITIGSSYTVAPYDFSIVKLSSSTLPITWLVDCGGSPNVATILLQR